MQNKKEYLSSLLKDLIILIFKWFFGLSLIITIIIQFHVIPSFVMIIFDLLLVINFIIREHFFNFHKKLRNDTYLFYINIILSFLMIIIFYQYWDIVKHFFMVE